MDYFFLGDPELVTAFRFVGIAGVAANDAAEARSAFSRISGATGVSDTPEDLGVAGISGAETCRVLIVTEEVADWLGETLIEWQLSNRYPLIVEMPGLMGRLPGRKSLVENIREAIGVHV
jgi:V/A-type H+-transporting ATPase subunit F